MQRRIFVLILIFFGQTSFGHFQMLIPNNDIVTNGKNNQISIEAKFWHPFEGHGMDMLKPAKIGVFNQGKLHDLLPHLKQTNINDRLKKSWRGYILNYTPKRPGDHVFYLQPQPYWEQSESTFIIHYTKVIVNAFGLQEGWDHEIGLKTEIVPLTRPYGFYTGNVFQGIVKLNGRPVPFSRVEVEYYNRDGLLKAPSDPYITQQIKADSRGVFTYAVPKAGWWGFAALNTDKKKMKRDGKTYPVELGAVLWIQARDMQ